MAIRLMATNPLNYPIRYSRVWNECTMQRYCRSYLAAHISTMNSNTWVPHRMLVLVCISLTKPETHMTLKCNSKTKLVTSYTKNHCIQRLAQIWSEWPASFHLWFAHAPILFIRSYATQPLKMSRDHDTIERAHRDLHKFTQGSFIRGDGAS
jgi:hypothetical protein